MGSDRRDPAELGKRLLARREPDSGFDRLVPAPLSGLADAAPLDAPAFGCTIDESAAGERELVRELVEWVQWETRSGFSLYHVRVTTGGKLLCGIVSPRAATAAANSFPPAALRCGLCLVALHRRGSEPMERRE